jgi:MOSC domain-containing protein YiiM
VADLETARPSPEPFPAGRERESEARVVAVHLSTSHSFSKFAEDEITLVEGLGVEGDAHAGTTVKHRSRVARDPSQPNLRQVHLLHGELFDELVEQGFPVFPGEMGENITTRGVDLLALPTGTRLHIGDESVVELTGLRNPCSQIDKFQKGLMAAVLDRAPDGSLVRKAGVMAIVASGGPVRAGDRIRVELPATPHLPLTPV